MTHSPSLLSPLRPLEEPTLTGSPTGSSWRVSSALPVSYSVRTCQDLLDPDNDDLEREAFGGPSRRRLIIVEQKVFDLYGTRLQAYLNHRDLPGHVVSLAADESVKNQHLANRVVDAIDGFGIDRKREPIVVIGGGVLLDVVGWVASSYRRGTPYIRIPTTLIGLVDAGVGIKTAVNHNGHKNIIGSYHPPVSALLDSHFLVTLPSRHVSNGMAEIAKMGLMCDVALWKLIAAQPDELIRTGLGSTDPSMRPGGQEILSRAIHSMLAELQPNLWEKDLHRLVDFGHTFSPVLEMAVLPELLHGEAVALDMAICSALSNRRGLLADGSLEEIMATLSRLGLPVDHPATTPELLDRGLAQATAHRGGMQRIPVPVEPGSAEFLEGVTSSELVDALDRVRRIARDL
ncbi:MULTISPECIES: sedoheptulose 7-phosphate cyclase [unclassified Streptomyces]|uniref:sedoheptulose 7-phosphate cyclase n=1 Tax=unclassified Streptomyces TaxID=2593676 RepID=UPI003811A54D